MSDVRYTGTKMVNLPCAAEAIYEGYLYADDGSGRMTLATTNTNPVIAIAAYSSFDCQTGAAVAKTAGDMHAFYLIGSGAIINVANEATHTWQFGDIVCAGETAVHLAMHDGSGHTHIGHYIGIDNTSFTTGELIVVVLDTPIGTT
jgi:hypothetical protein